MFLLLSLCWSEKCYSIVINVELAVLVFSGKGAYVLFFGVSRRFCCDAGALWESDSVLGPQRKPECYFSDLYPKSPCVKYQTKISPTWAFL